MTGTTTQTNSAPAATTTTTTTATTAAPGGNAAPADGGGSQPAAADVVSDAKNTFAEGYNKTAEQNSDPAADAPSGDKEGTGESEDKPASEGKTPDDQENGQEGKTEEDSEQVQEYQQFTLPEGVELNQGALDKATPILQKYKMPQEDAQALVDIASEMVSDATAQATSAHEKLVDEWHTQTMEQYGKDGPDQFKEKAGIAKVAINKFFSPAELKVLDAYGVGNLPGLFGLAYHVGLAMKEDGNILAGKTGGGSGEESLADTWYGSK